jgi:hypothetical protein
MLLKLISVGYTNKGTGHSQTRDWPKWHGRILTLPRQTAEKWACFEKTDSKIESFG